MDPYERLIKVAAKKAVAALREKEDAKRRRTAAKHAAQAIAANRKRAPNGD